MPRVDVCVTFIHFTTWGFTTCANCKIIIIKSCKSEVWSFLPFQLHSRSTLFHFVSRYTASCGLLGLYGPSGNVNSTIMPDVCNDLISSVSLTRDYREWHVKFTRVWQNELFELGNHAKYDDALWRNFSLSTTILRVNTENFVSEFISRLTNKHGFWN